MTDRGQRLQYAMLLRGYRKQHALAHLLGVTESTVTRWKKNKAISVDHAIALCAALEISLDWFLRGIGPIGISCDDEYPTPPTPKSYRLEEATTAFAHCARYNH